MLIHFDSDVGEFTMAGDAAVQLLKMMGHSGTVPSAILAADIPAAVARLRTAVRHGAPAAAGAGRRGGARVRAAQAAAPSR